MYCNKEFFAAFVMFLGLLGTEQTQVLSSSHTRIFQLKLWVSDAAFPPLPLEQSVRVLSLGVLVQGLHVGMGRRGVQVVIVLLAIFTMVSLWTWHKCVNRKLLVRGQFGR